MRLYNQLSVLRDGPGIRISLLQLVKMKRFTQVLRYSKPRPNESDKLKIYPCKTCNIKAL